MEVTDRDFESEVLKSEEPVLVDFWAPWCGPCRAVAPIVEELSGEYAGKVKFTKLNTDDSPQIPGKYRIMGIPTLIVFKGGKEVGRIVGARPKGDLKREIDKALV
jgi:thioredoxin 1